MASSQFDPVNGTAILTSSGKPTARIDGSALRQGDRWYNPALGIEYYYDSVGLVWQVAGGVVNGVTINGVANFWQTTAPTPLAVGDHWYNPNTGETAFWNGTYWLSTQVYGPRGSYTFVGAESPNDLSYTKGGVGLTRGIFVEDLSVIYKADSTDHDASNYFTLSLRFRNSRNQTDEFSELITFGLDGSTYQPSGASNSQMVALPLAASYNTVTWNLNTYGGARGDIYTQTFSTTVTGSPSYLRMSFHLKCREVLG